MVKIIQSDTFRRWISHLDDRQAAAKIHARLDRVMLGNPGDMRAIRDGVFELRIDYGPGYRVYFLRRGSSLIILLAGGDKGSQKTDIIRAMELAGIWREYQDG